MAGLEGCSCAAASIRRTACCVCPRAARARPSSCSASALPGSRASTSRYSGTASVRRPWSWAARARASIAPLSATVACAAARGRRGYRVALHEIAERLLQPRKPGLVVTPLIDALGIERLADLLRADGLHDAGVLVEAQAPRFRRQAPVVKGPPALAFRNYDQEHVN